MNNQDIVPDDEELYRRIPVELKGIAYSIEDGKFVIRPAAFRDRSLAVSVDRAKLNNFDPSLTQLKEENGIVKMKTGDVCKIEGVVTKDKGNVIFHHAVKVVAKPIDDPISSNPAHAEIIVKPKYFGSNTKKKNAFELLTIALARLANENGWLIEPTPP